MTCLGLGMLSSCSPGASGAGPPITVCGQHLWGPGGAAAEPGLYQVPGRGYPQPSPTLQIGSYSLPLLVQVSRNCQHGAAATITPSDLVQVQELYAGDGKPIALWIIGEHPGYATLTVRRNGNLLGRLSFSVVQ